MKKTWLTRYKGYAVGATMFSVAMLGIWSPATAEDMPKVMNLGTHGLGTLINAMGVGLAKTLSAHLDTQVKVMPTSGPREWLPQTATGEMQMGILNNFDALHGRRATGGYEKALQNKGAPIFLLTAGTRNWLGFLTTTDSGITSCADLKGKRIVDRNTGSAGVTAQGHALVANCGLKPGDYKSVVVAGGPAKSVQTLIDGTSDAVTAAVGMGIIAELDAKRGALFVTMDGSPEGWARFRENFPADPVTVEPSKGRAGVKQAVTVAEYPFYLVGAGRLSEDTAYQIVKVLWERNEELFGLHARLKQWVKENYVSESATIPYHPGAVRFYKEVGAWSPRMDEVQARLLTQ
jgi:TRAP transporter TAXI family solute receptor